MDVKKVPLVTVKDLKKQEGRLLVVVDGQVAALTLEDLLEYLMYGSTANTVSEQAKVAETSRIPAGFTLHQFDSQPDSLNMPEGLTEEEIE